MFQACFMLAVLGCHHGPDSSPDSQRHDSTVRDDSASDSGAKDDTGHLTHHRLAPSHGPYISDISATTATVWARWPHLGPAELFLASEADFADARSIGTATSDPDHDFTLHWTARDLEPGVDYYYLVTEAGSSPRDVLSTERTFRTLTPAGTNADIRIAFLSDLGEDFTAPTSYLVAGAAPDFAVQLGDFDHRNPGLDPKAEIGAWWKMDRDSLFDGPPGVDIDLGLLHQTPFIHIWDDHDFGANNADKTAWFRDEAMDSFRDYFPFDDGPAGTSGFWHSVRDGQVEVFILDLRSQRDPNDAIPRAMLGLRTDSPNQLGWLIEGVQSSSATWKIIVSSSCWNPHGKTVDSWDRYPEDRSRIVDALASVPGVVIVSGDIHSGGAIDDGTNSFRPELSVPTMNMNGPCTTRGQGCGTWSVGLYPGEDTSGFGLIEATYDSKTKAHHLAISAVGHDGTERVRYDMSL